MARSRNERRKFAKQQRKLGLVDKERQKDEKWIGRHTEHGDLPFPSKHSAKQGRNLAKYWRNMTYSGTCWVRKDEAKRASRVVTVA